MESLWVEQSAIMTSAFNVNTTNFPSLNFYFKPFLTSKNIKLGIKIAPFISAESGQNKFYSQAVGDNLLIDSAINPMLQEGKLT